PSLCLGAHFTMLSTLKIISAASVAEISAYSFTLKHSVTPNSLIFPILPENIFNPESTSPFAIELLRFYTNSALS
ncbi:MAG: hypothetical protein ACK5NI_00875, partial [bacterium]